MEKKFLSWKKNFMEIKNLPYRIGGKKDDSDFLGQQSGGMRPNLLILRYSFIGSIRSTVTVCFGARRAEKLLSGADKSENSGFRRIWNLDSAWL